MAYKVDWNRLSDYQDIRYYWPEENPTFGLPDNRYFVQYAACLQPRPLHLRLHPPAPALQGSPRRSQSRRPQRPLEAKHPTY